MLIFLKMKGGAFNPCVFATVISILNQISSALSIELTIFTGIVSTRTKFMEFYMSMSPAELYEKSCAEIINKIEKVSTDFFAMLGTGNPDLKVVPELLTEPQTYLKILKEFGEISFSRLEVFCTLRRELDAIKAFIDQVPQPNNKKDWVAHLREGVRATEEHIIEMQTLEARRFCILTKAAHCPLETEKSANL